MSKKLKKNNKKTQQLREQVAARSKSAHFPNNPEALEAFCGMNWLIMNEATRLDWTEKNVHEADDYIAAYQVFGTVNNKDFESWVKTELLGVYKESYEGRSLSALASDLEMLVETIQLNSVEPEILRQGLNELIELGFVGTKVGKGNRVVVYKTMPINWKLKQKHLPLIMKIILELSRHGNITVFRFV